MASYGNFQDDNQKYTLKTSRLVTNNPSFMPAVKVVGEEQKRGIKKNLKKWVDLVSWSRWYPDLFFDLITPETGALVKLNLDQRIYLRSLVRFNSVYNVEPRGSGKTLVALMYCFHTCIFYPNIEFGFTAQTQKNSAKLVREKYDLLLRAFPLLKEEVYSAKFSVDNAEVEFHNGSRIRNFINHPSSKGSHAQRGLIDEDNLMDEETYLDVLEPVFTTVPRHTVGKYSVVDFCERNGSVSQMTTSGFKGSPAYYRCLRHFNNMVELKGEMCLGAGWELANWYGRGMSKERIAKKKKESTAVSFNMNYDSVWTGCADGALVSITKLLKCRTLTRAEFGSEPNGEYVFGVDVARSDNDDNNQTSIAVLKKIAREDGRIKEVHLVNIITIGGSMDFDAQAMEIKRLDRLYNAIAIIIDDNGLGKGLGDRLVKKQIDPVTGEVLGAYDTFNSSRIPDGGEAPKKVFCYLGQSFDTQSITDFIDGVETGKLRLLERKDVATYDAALNEDSKREVLPFIQTDFFIEEVSNLKLKHLNNGKLSIEPVVRKMNKDRFSATQYALWYIYTYMDNEEMDSSSDIDFLEKFCSGW